MNFFSWFCGYDNSPNKLASFFAFGLRIKIRHEKHGACDVRANIEVGSKSRELHLQLEMNPCEKREKEIHS